MRGVPQPVKAAAGGRRAECDKSVFGQAHAIGWPLLDMLRGTEGVAGHVLSVHRHASYLLLDNGSLLTLGDLALGAGPFTIVVAQPPAGGPWPPPGSAAHIAVTRLHVGTWTLDLSQARAWQPSPDWPALIDAPGLAQGIQALQTWYERPLVPAAGCTQVLRAGLAAANHRLIHAAGLAELTNAVAGLLGLGPGLTPAGDDWIAGWLLRLHLRRPGQAWPTLETAAALVLARAAAQTNRISRALLAAAAAGWVDQAWFDLLAALADGRSQPVERAAAAVARHGATSGMAMLAGFLLKEMNS